MVTAGEDIPAVITSIYKGEDDCMTVEKIFELAGIPALLVVICMYYGIRLIVTKDATTIRGRNQAVLKDEKAYAVEAGKLMLFFGAATLIMGILLFVNINIAVAEIIVCTVILGILWKRMNDKYGC